jgi:hypothetical protein
MGALKALLCLIYFVLFAFSFVLRCDKNSTVVLWANIITLLIAE